MAEAAVADRPETETDTGAETPDDTGDREEIAVTDGGADVQAGEGEGSVSAGVEAAIKAGTDAELEAEVERRVQERLTGVKSEARERNKREQKNAKVNAFKDDLIAALGIDDDEGKQAVHKKGDALSLDINAVVEAAVLEEYAEVIEGMVPEGRRKAFVEEHNLKPLQDWLKGAAEEIALESKAVKGADPESLIKANGKLAKHVDAYGKEQYEKGRDNPRPTGESKGDERGAGTTGLTPTEYKNRLASDIPPTPAEVDAMTRAYLT